MSGKLPIFNASALNDSTDIEKISSDSKAYAEEIDYLLEGEGVMSVKRSRYFFSPRSWLKSKGVGLRYVSRSRIIFIFFVLLIVQVTIFMLSEPTWIAIQPAMVTSDDELTALHTTEFVRRPRAIMSHLELLQDDAAYLEAWVGSGKMLPGLDFRPYDKIDGLWSWLNGSDPRHQANIDYLSKGPNKTLDIPFPGSVTKSRFRENNELLYSLRSAKAALGGYLRTIHLVTADYWPSGEPDDLPSGNSSELAGILTVESEDFGQSDVFHIEKGLAKYGQVPQWMNLQHPSIKVGDDSRIIDRGEPAPQLRIHHDWSMWTQLHNVDAETGEPPEQPSVDETIKWKLEVLPTFNSGAKEACMGLNITDLSDAFFYSNDDYYLGRNLTAADLSSPMFGPVLLLSRWSTIDPIENQEDGLGEHPSYRYTTWLLGQRFGVRKRSYIHHVHKTFIRPLVHEYQLMFGDELNFSASQRFRGKGQFVNQQLMAYNFVMERHREALLWSYFVLRLDQDGDGAYSDSELAQAYADLGFDGKRPGRKVDVPMPLRDTLLHSKVKHVFDTLGVSMPMQSRYAFSSQDGYALAELNFTKKIDNAWPDFADPPHSPTAPIGQPIAVMDWDGCWTSEMERDPIKLFRHVAFAKPECGDQMITLLVGLSGRTGLSAFLPPREALFPKLSGSASDGRKPQGTPHLPLNHRWADAAFSMRDVARNTGWAGHSRRVFAMMLIQRYAYTMGSVNLKFDMLTGMKAAKDIFEKFEKEGNRQAHPFFGINDDMSDKDFDETTQFFQEWMEKMWPAKQFRLPYERT